MGGRTATRIHLIEGVSNNDVLFFPAAILTACFLVLIKVNGRGHSTDKRWCCQLEDLAKRLDGNQGMIRSLDLDATTGNLIPKNSLWKESQTTVSSLVHYNGFQNGFIKYSDLHYESINDM